jgi:hypothetical protein
LPTRATRTTISDRATYLAYTGVIGLDPDQFAGHSLRAGLADEPTAG